MFLTVRKETEEMVNAINREEGSEHNDTATGFAAGSSPMPLGLWLSSQFFLSKMLSCGIYL
jgi:hypothetical protein